MAAAPRPDGATEPAGHASASRELLRAREILADGRWHDFESVMRELVRVVAPGRASRAAEGARVDHLRRRARILGVPLEEVPPRARPADPDRVRETGARIIVRKMIAATDFEVDRGGQRGARRIRWPRSASTRTQPPRPLD